MAKQQPIVQDDLKEMVFPYGGLALTGPSLQARPDTTDVAENVRFFEPLTGRGRGGSRPGIDRFIDEEVSGANGIQHLATIVTTDGEMLDWSFDGPNQEFPGVYGGIGFIDLGLVPLSPIFFPTIPDDGDGSVFIGGSGYGPKDPTKKTTLEIAVDPTETTINLNSILTFTLVDGDRNPFMLANKTVTLHTDPPGEVGDGFTTTVVGGSTQTDVTATSPKKVFYYAEAVSNRGAVVARSNRVHVRYVDGTPPPPTLAYVQSLSSSTTAGTVATRIVAVEAGELLLVFFGAYGAPVASTTASVSDTQTNTYTQVGSYLRETTDDVFAVPMVMTAFRTFASATGTMTITVTADTSCDFGIAVHRISGAKTSAPVRAIATNTVHGAGGDPTGCTTTSVSAASGDMIIANFVAPPGTFTLPGTGYTVAAMAQSGAGSCERHESVSGAEAATGARVSPSSYVAIAIAIQVGP